MYDQYKKNWVAGIGALVVAAGCSDGATSSTECGVAFRRARDAQAVSHVVLHDSQGAFLELGKLSEDSDAYFGCESGYQISVVHDFNPDPVSSLPGDDVLIQTFMDLEPGMVVTIGTVVGDLETQALVQAPSEGLPGEPRTNVTFLTACTGLTFQTKPIGVPNLVDLRCAGDDPTNVDVMALAFDGFDHYYSAAYDIPVESLDELAITTPWQLGPREAVVVNGGIATEFKLGMVHDGEVIYVAGADNTATVTRPPADMVDSLVFAVPASSTGNSWVAESVAPDAPFSIDASDALGDFSDVRLFDGDYGLAVELRHPHSPGETDISFVELTQRQSPSGDVIWQLQGRERSELAIPEFPEGVFPRFAPSSAHVFASKIDFVSRNYDQVMDLEFHNEYFMARSRPPEGERTRFARFEGQLQTE